MRLEGVSEGDQHVVNGSVHFHTETGNSGRRLHLEERPQPGQVLSQASSLAPWLCSCSGRGTLLGFLWQVDLSVSCYFL